MSWGMIWRPLQSRSGTQHWAMAAWGAWQPASWTPWPPSTCLPGATASATATACSDRCGGGGAAAAGRCSRRAVVVKQLQGGLVSRCRGGHACQSARSLNAANGMLTQCEHVVCTGMLRQSVVLCWCVLQSIMNGFQHEQPDYWLTFGRWRAPLAASATRLRRASCLMFAQPVAQICHLTCWPADCAGSVLTSAPSLHWYLP